MKEAGALGRFASRLPKIGGKPGGKPPPPKATGTRSPMGKPGKVLRRRSALSPLVKAGILVAVLCLCVGAYFSYRFLGPDDSANVHIKLPKPGDHHAATDGSPKVVSLPTPVPSPKADDDSDDDKPVPTPTPTLMPSGPHQIVMGDTTVDSDVRVGSTPLDAAPSASAAFRSFVANAVIGGVFQGRPARALINGTIAREGQVVNSSLGIAFERIDSPKKMIYFKDYTGAEVSKSY